MKHVVISIINYNRAEITKDCLKSLNHLTHEGLDLTTLVIDNASKVPIELNEKDYPHLRLEVIYNKENKGFAGGHNIGFKYGLDKGADYVVILNNDVTVDKDCIRQLISAGESRPDAGILSPKIYFSKGSEYHKERYKEKELGHVLWYAGGLIDWNNAYWTHRGVDEVDHGQYDKAESTHFASGCCLAIKREVLEKVKGFDEAYFLYYEDSDLNERVKKEGYTIFYVPDAFLWHKNAGSTGGSGSPLQDYFTTRNRLLIGSRFGPARTKAALIRESLTLLRTGREWQKKEL